MTLVALRRRLAMELTPGAWADAVVAVLALLPRTSRRPSTRWSARRLAAHLAAGRVAGSLYLAGWLAEALAREGRRDLAFLVRLLGDVVELRATRCGRYRRLPADLREALGDRLNPPAAAGRKTR